MSSFYKQLYRYSHPRSFRHNETLWPFVKIRRAVTGEIISVSYKQQQIPMTGLSEFAARYQGEILLSATGPSVNSLNFDLFPPIPAMGVNGAYHLNKKVQFRFYIIVDMGFFNDRPQIVQHIIADPALKLFTTVHGIINIVNNFGREQIKCTLIPIEDISYRIFEPFVPIKDIRQTLRPPPGLLYSQEREDIAFNSDIRQGIADAATVIYWALQILSFCGFKKIYIIGLDMNNFNQPRFYEDNQDKLPTLLDIFLENTILPSLKHASEILRKNEVKVINLSPQSAIPDSIFKKENGNDFFSRQ